MFPSCGFFTSIPCQFYVNGLCERPYCHFRHSRHDAEKLRETATSSLVDAADSVTSNGGQESVVSEDGSQKSAVSEPRSNSSSSQNTSLTSEPPETAPLEAHNGTRENNAGSFSIPSFTDNSSKYQVPVAEEPEQYVTSHRNDSDQVQRSSLYADMDVETSELPTYLPTPKTPSLPVPEPVKDDSGIPVYQPTPKRELKRRYEDQVPTKKAKSADLEYDPECNFSCGGLIGSSQDKSKVKSDLLSQPTVKKARISGSRHKRSRLSCESLIASSPDAVDELQEVPEGEFSEQEEDSCEKTGEVAEAVEEEMGNEEDRSDDFENIGDDDISSDDDLIEVPSVPVKASVSKKEKHHSMKAVKKNSSYSGHSSDKSSLSKKKLNRTGSNERHKRDENKASKHSSSSESYEQTSKSSSDRRLDKVKRLSSSQKKAGHCSSTGSSRKVSSSSAKGHSTEKSHLSEKIHHTSKLKTEHGASEVHIKNKKDALKSNHDRSSASKSLPKSSSSDKLHISDKHLSVSLKTVVPAISKPVSDSNSGKRPSADGKYKDSGERRSSLERKTSKERQLSLERKTSKDIAGKHDHGAESKSKNFSSRQSLFESMTLKEKSSESEKYSKTDKKIIVKQSESDGKCDMKKLSVKYSNSDYKANFDKLSESGTDRHKLSSGERRSSIDRRPSSTDQCSSSGSKRAVEHHASSSSNKAGFSSKDHSKDRSAHTSDKTYHSSKQEKGHRSSHRELEKTRSSGKHTDMSKATHFNLCPKKKSRDKDLKKEDSNKTLQRLNSSLFGEDTDEDVEDNVLASDDHSEPSDYRETVEKEHVDYSKYINDSDLEEEDTFDECLRIFKETPLPKKTSAQPVKKLTKDQNKESPGSSGTTYSLTGKKRRVAHPSAEQARRLELLRKEKPRHIMSPQEQMHNRILLMQQRAQERAAMQAVQEQEVSSTSGSGTRQRIAHVQKAPATSSLTVTSASSGQKNTTIAMTVPKSEKRVAHTPNLTNLKRPIIPANFGSKVPSNIRQRYLNLIIDECLKFCPSEEKAYKKGLEEEAGVYDRSSNKNIYLRVAVNAITRLRSEAKESMPGTSTTRQPQQSGPSQSHEATLGGARAAKTNFTLQRSSGGKKTEVALTEPELYQKLLKYALTETQLEENGYPRPCPDMPGKAIMLGKSYQDTDTLLKDNERTCARCGKRFIVNSDGSYARDEECVYHWTRAYPRKKSGFIQHIYNCCNSDTSSKGCQVAGNHVHDRNKRDNLRGFMRTIQRSAPKDGNYGIYALDCEMVYTQGGLELARVTVVNMNGESVFESLVQPFHPIIDYNTRFSGLTAADLADVEVTLTEVQAILLNMFSDKTILIGHSLESDFFALKLIHSTVVDTSLVFPHRLGPPYKRALKNLMLEIFQKIIQCDDGGHDSKEDALACLQLMKWRIKEDSKREHRYSRD